MYTKHPPSHVTKPDSGVKELAACAVSIIESFSHHTGNCGWASRKNKFALVLPGGESKTNLNRMFGRLNSCLVSAVNEGNFYADAKGLECYLL